MKKMIQSLLSKRNLIARGLIISFTLLSCELPNSNPSKGFGSAVFYMSSNARGRTEITVSGNKINPVSFVVPVTTNPNSYCENGWTGYVLLDVGTYNYKATAADGTKWSDTFEVTKDFCLQRRLQ